MSNSRFLSTLSLAVAVLISSCRKPIVDAPIQGAYSLAYYESVPHDQIFLIYGDRAVIPPNIDSFAIFGRDFAGHITSANDSAFESVNSGYFFFNTLTKELMHGLSWTDLAQELPDLRETHLRPATMYWKDLAGRHPR